MRELYYAYCGGRAEQQQRGVGGAQPGGGAVALDEALVPQRRTERERLVS